MLFVVTALSEVILVSKNGKLLITVYQKERNALDQWASCPRGICSSPGGKPAHIPPGEHRFPEGRELVLAGAPCMFLLCNPGKATGGVAGGRNQYKKPKNPNKPQTVSESLLLLALVCRCCVVGGFVCEE